MMLAVSVKDAMIKAATHMIEQNYMLAMRDLARARAESSAGIGEMPITITFKMESGGKKIYIDPSIEWKRTVTAGDSMDLITIDPEQPELPGTTPAVLPDVGIIEQAKLIIKETGRASVSNLQRRMRIGYTQAAHIMDVLEECGFVGPARGSDPREILA